MSPCWSSREGSVLNIERFDANIFGGKLEGSGSPGPVERTGLSGRLYHTGTEHGNPL